MAVERTFSIIKPDATERNLTGAINQVIEAAGLRVVAQRRIHMSRAQAERFYGVHSERPFFGELVDFMISAPVVVQVLEGENAIANYREVMGATNPEEAADGTVRILPPGVAPASKTVTRTPAASKRRALAKPAIPAPTTITCLGGCIRYLRR